MDVDIEGKRRNILPRLRDFRTTLALGELASGNAPIQDRRLPEEVLDKQISDWRHHKTLAFATDLVGSAVASGVRVGIKDAVDFILSEDSNSTELQRRVALQALDSDFCTHPIREEDLRAASSKALINKSRERVRRLRASIREGLRNPIKLVDLAREYIVLGSREKAKRAMITAVAQSPANRFVLRSAARLFVHIGEAERAHHILKNAPSLRSDPWILSAEIAVSSLLQRTSGQIHAGIGQLDSQNFDDFHTSELASAIATLELENANSKLARKLFRRALRHPTENSIAQAEWASRELGSLPVEVDTYTAPLKYEALTRHYYAHDAWEDALLQGKGWVLDQPFSVTPVLFAGNVAAILEKYELSEAICRFGLKANPDNKMIRNNLAYVLASNNQPYVAEQEFARIDRSKLSAEDRIFITATEGLIQFRKGAPETGRVLYRRAIELAKDNKMSAYAARALVYLAREEIRANTEAAQIALLNAEREVKRIELTGELSTVLRKLKRQIEGDTASLKVANDLVGDMKRIVEGSREPNR